jgi:hypothetical protein
VTYQAVGTALWADRRGAGRDGSPRFYVGLESQMDVLWVTYQAVGTALWADRRGAGRDGSPRYQQVIPKNNR